MKIDAEGIQACLLTLGRETFARQVEDLDKDWHVLVGENMRLRKQVEEAAKVASDLLPQVEVLRVRHLQCEAERDNWKFLQEETSKSRAEWQARAEKAEAEAAKYSKWWEDEGTEVQETLARETAAVTRAEKAEAQLAECLAATNEVLQEALASGRAEEDVPEKALVKAVRRAYRLGAEEMRAQCVEFANEGYKLRQVGYRAACIDISTHLSSLPLPGEGT